MVNKMNVDKKILEELKRYNSINRYISEQEAPVGELPPPPGGELPPPPGGDATPTPPAEPQVIDTATDPDVEKIDASGKSEEAPTEGGSEELDITDLVNSQKTVETKQEEYFSKLFSHLENLESKLSDMDKIVGMLNSLEAKVEKYRPRTAQEKLELRSLDSGPFNQKLTDFFTDKQGDIEKSGKNEYVLTTDDVEDYSVDEIKRTFSDYGDEDEFKPLKY